MSGTEELHVAERQVMRAITKLEIEREDLLKSLCAVEHALIVVQPFLQALRGVQH